MSLAARPAVSGRARPGAVRSAAAGASMESARAGLCRAHLRPPEGAAGMPTKGFLSHPQTRPLPPVRAVRGRRLHPPTPQPRRPVLRRAPAAAARRPRDDPALDETTGGRTEPAIGRGGEVSLRGLAPLVVAAGAGRAAAALPDQRGQDRRSRPAGRVQRPAAPAAGLDCWTTSSADDRGLAFTGLANCLVAHARRALSNPETEVAQDSGIWSLFGHSGTVASPASASAGCGRAAKRWAADDLPKRRINPGRRTSGGWRVRHHIGCLVRLSESLRLRADRGEHPRVLGRADMEAFLHGWPTWNRSGRSAAMPGSGPAARSAPSWSASAPWD